MVYISRNFEKLIADPKISLLSKEQLSLMLKHKSLRVAQEDQVLHAVCLWLQGRLDYS
jgi:hypothetical protein